MIDRDRLEGIAGVEEQRTDAILERVEDIEELRLVRVVAGSLERLADHESRRKRPVALRQIRF